MAAHTATTDHAISAVLADALIKRLARGEDFTALARCAEYIRKPAPRTPESTAP